MKKDNKLKDIVYLQLCVCFFSLSSIASKFASNYVFLSYKFILCYSIEIMILGIYAIVWQQIIKKNEISIVYASKATTIFWSLLWSFIVFKENITIQNIIGTILIFIGVLVVNKNV